MSGSQKEARSQEGRLSETSLSSTVGLVAGVLGTTSAVFGLLLYAIDPSAVSIALSNFIFAAAALVFYALTNRAALRRMFTGRSSALGLVELLVITSVTGAIVAANYFASKSTKEWDLTRDHLFSLHEQSIKVVKNLKSPVRVLGFYRPAETQRAQLLNLVGLYEAHSDRISVEIINPDTAAPAIYSEFKMTAGSPKIVVTAGGDKQTKISAPSEEALTNALIRVAENPVRKVYFLTGHGEADIDDAEGDGGYRRAAQTIIDDGYEAEKLSLIDKDEVPNDAAVVVVAGSRSALFPNEVGALSAYLKLGGRVLLLLDTGLEPGTDEILRSFGVEVGDDLVLDPNPASKAQGFGADAPVVMKFEQHPVTESLNGLAVLFYWTRSVQPKLGTAGINVVTLIQTSAASWAEKNWREGGDVARDENDLPGPIPIAVAAVKNTAVVADKKTDEARLVVFGDASFASNRFMTIRGNSNLLINAINWLAGDEQKISIRPPQRGSSRLVLSQTEQFGIVFFSVNLLPLVLVGVGFSVWAVRRRK